MDFKFALPVIYINFDIQTNFKVNRAEICHFVLGVLVNDTWAKIGF